jgi:hypothetical protein
MSDSFLIIMLDHAPETPVTYALYHACIQVVSRVLMQTSPNLLSLMQLFIFMQCLPHM